MKIKLENGWSVKTEENGNFWEVCEKETKQHFGGLGKHVFKAKKWLAKYTINPASKFGKDMSFLPASRADEYEFSFSDLKIGDKLEYCETCYRSNKYFEEYRIKLEIVSIDEKEVEFKVI